MSEEIKTYRVVGTLLKQGKKTNFTVDVRATRMDIAVFKVRENLGSRHKVKTNMVKIKEVKEISPQESKDPLIQQLGSGE